MTAVLSGIDQALWDIKGKALGLPVYELLGGPTRDRIHIYGSEGDARKGLVNAFKTAPYADNRQAYRYVESPGYIQRAAKRFGALREELGPEINIGILMSPAPCSDRMNTKWNAQRQKTGAW